MLKKSIPLVLVLIVALCFSEAFADVKEVTLYSGSDYSGNTINLTPGDYLLDQLNTAEIKDGKVLSITIPTGYTAKIFNGYFAGRWMELKSDVNNLSEKFKYRIGSIRIWKDNDDFNAIFKQTGSGWNSISFNDEVETILPHIILFRDKNLKGPHIHIFGPVDNLSDYDFDDQLSSFVVLSGRWTFCLNKKYGAPCNFTFTRGIYSDVTENEIYGIPDDAISSVMCQF